VPRYQCPPNALHRAWDNRLPPALTVAPGDTVTFSTADALDGDVAAPAWATPRPPTRHLGVQPAIPRGHTLSGPVAMRGAGPGDILVVEVLEVTPDEWGWTRTSDNGILGAQASERTQIHWDLRGARAVPSPAMARPVHIPMRPFCGVMGVAPAEPAEHSTVPPRAVGGNLDVRHLVAGSTLLLPIAVAGGLFSCGDVHAAQGDGEACGTGIECAATVTLRFNLRHGAEMPGPAFIAPPPPAAGQRYGVTGIGPDLMGATRQAIGRMIAYLQSEYDLSFGEAYILCSVAVDLAISEVVNPPNWVVTALLPLNVVGP
jgi:acetamidase/formamidase